MTFLVDLDIPSDDPGILDLAHQIDDALAAQGIHVLSVKPWASHGSGATSLSAIANALPSNLPGQPA